MNTRRLACGFLVLCACTRKSDDAGIVLNIDTEVSADRTVINHITITVDGKRQEWSLTRALPGSLGIVTSPGMRSVTVEGLSSGVLRGRWTGSILAIKGSVVVQDVHLAYVAPGVPDGGAPSIDSSVAEAARADAPSMESGIAEAARADGARDSALEAGMDRPDSGGEVGGTGGISGGGGTSGTGTLPPVDGGSGGLGGNDGGSRETAGRDGGDASSPDESDGPLPSSDTAPAVTMPLTGAFAVSSDFDIAATAAAPGPINDALAVVHRFVDDPGAAILDFADQAGNPSLSALRAVLPDALESRLTGWMDSYIKTATVNGVTPYDRLVWLDDTVRALLLYWGLESRLALPLSAPGTHSPMTLRFASLSGTSYSIPFDPTAQVTSGTGVTASVSWPGGSPGSPIVTISDHVMAFAFGRYALQALDEIMLAEYGVPDTAAYLSSSIGCSGMAAYVASQCVSIICVGHATELNDICESGLAEGARQIEQQITAIDFKAIHFQQGSATAIGAQVTSPQSTTALRDGIWSVTVDFGNGPDPANATFTASAEAGS